MNRRDFVKAGMTGTAATLAAHPATAALAKEPGQQFIAQADVAQLQAAMAAGKQTAQSIAKLYLARIAKLDKAGPRINAIIELNPDALAIAKALDAERKAKGPRGPMHGIPVLLKDNIATGDKMLTTAGSLALAHGPAVKDSAVAQRLREAGAVILGKTNLSEWANLRSTRSTSGWSGRGGLSRNPYALDRSTSGSSSGSGGGIAASLAAVAVGTETNGSIISPASICGLVGIKPTVGLVSRSGIIPLSHTQDTAGPMARSVADAAALLSAMAGVDASDSATTQAGAVRPGDYSKFLDKGALKGKRLGVVRNYFGGKRDLIDAEIEKALAVLREQGATLVDCELQNFAKTQSSSLPVLLYEFKAGLAAYLKDYAPNAPIKSMADLIAFNLANKDKELKYFGQEYLIQAEAKGDLNTKEYLDALANNQRYTRAEGLDLLLSGDQKFDALVAPSNSTAWLIDLINGDTSLGGFSGPAAIAGYPHITVPAGQVQGLPVALSFVGAAWTEGTLLGMAYAYEQATLLRRAPTFARSVNPLG